MLLNCNALQYWETMMHAQPLALIQSMKILSRVSSLAFNTRMVIWSFIHMSYLKERDKAKDKNYGNNPITYRSSISVLKSISLRSTHCAIKATYMHANRGVGFRREPFLICVSFCIQTKFIRTFERELKKQGKVSSKICSRVAICQLIPV